MASSSTWLRGTCSECGTEVIRDPDSDTVIHLEARGDSGLRCVLKPESLDGLLAGRLN